MRAKNRSFYNRTYPAHHMDGVVRFRVKPMPEHARAWTWQLRRGRA